MADIIDKGNETADFFLDKALQERKRLARVATPHGVGLCLNCGDEIDGDRRWCDADCRNQWEADNRVGMHGATRSESSKRR